MINSFRDEYRFLSNFFIHRHDGKSGEHAYQAAKCSDLWESDWVWNSNTPGVAKRRGRKVQIRPDWEDVKDEMMLHTLREKFSDVYPEMVKLLLATGDQELVEGNHWHDNYWGVCHCGKCDQTQAQNKLGKMLMQVRKEIRDAE
jgi:ribA/ribD-fused uncharacterized protein